MRKISILARAAAAIFCAIAIVVAPMAQAKSAQEIYSGESSEERQKCLSSPTVDCLFEIAFRTVDKIDHPGDHASALREIAAAQAEAGLFPNALRIAESLESTRFDHMIHHVDALIDIAAAFAEAGHGVDAKNTFTNAVRVAEKIDRPNWRASALSDITVAQAKASLFPNALRTTEKIEDRLDSTSVSTDIAAVQAKEDLFLNALQTAEKIEDTYDRDRSLRKIAAAQTEAGLFPNALRIAEKIEDAYDRASILSNVAIAQAETGDIKNAIETSAKIDDENLFLHIRTLARIAVALAKAR